MIWIADKAEKFSDKTEEIEDYFCDDRRRMVIVRFRNNPKEYSYPFKRVLILTNPKVHQHQDNRYFKMDTNRRLPLFNIERVEEYAEHLYITFSKEGDSCSRLYHKGEIVVERSCVQDHSSKQLMNYFRDVVNLCSGDSEPAYDLNICYKRKPFFSSESAANIYINPKTSKPKTYSCQSVIFPFGCNASQQAAVRKALTNQFSIIQGPPGTGKTMTIVNLIANLLIKRKSVLVVSNNSSAVENVQAKLQSVGLDFLVANLGKKENREAFYQNQKPIPANIEDWCHKEADIPEYVQKINKLSEDISDRFVKEERLACCMREVNALDTERMHFEQSSEIQSDISFKKKVSSAQLMATWIGLEHLISRERRGVFRRITKLFDRVAIWRLLRKVIRNAKDHLDESINIILCIQRKFYQAKKEELYDEIRLLQRVLDRESDANMLDDLKSMSMLYLKNNLYRRYGTKHERRVFSEKDKNDLTKEYPISLSTAQSACKNMPADFLYDYIIMDEASQVPIDVALLALSCAKNAVIVGDIKQLPCIMNSPRKAAAQEMMKDMKIDSRYDKFSYSFLESAIAVLPEVPGTLLREHYRCHPKIIDFCNQKFYDNNLVIMTKYDDNEAISVIRTVMGNHQRGRTNEREVDEVIDCLTKCSQYKDSEIGIITPFNDQKRLLLSRLKEIGRTSIEVSTVDSFQGQEKDLIFLTMTQNQLSPFVDDPNRLNVAVSRAKKKFVLVLSGNEQRMDWHTMDLVSYIEYNNGTVIDSNLSSIFDMLYSQYAQVRKEYLKKYSHISEYESEQLAYRLLEEIIQENEKYFNLDIVCHLSLCNIFKDLSGLSDEEVLFVKNPNSHLDFLLFNRLNKRPILAIEIDGGSHLEERQRIRDEKKNRILNHFGLALLRLPTTGSREKEKVLEKLRSVLSYE